MAEETTTEGGSSRSSEVKAGSSIDSGTGDLDQGDSSPGVKVRVSRIKKLLPTDDDDLDDESEMTETDLDAEEMEELNMEKRMRQATKKMEEMVKEQLRNSGVLPSGNFVFSYGKIKSLKIKALSFPVAVVGLNIRRSNKLVIRYQKLCLLLP